MAGKPEILNNKALDLKKISWGDLTWVDISGPNEDAKKYLQENYNFHPMDVEDCFSRRQLSKMDEYEHYIFVVFHFPVYDKVTRTSATQQWSAFIGENYLITLHPKSLVALEKARQDFEAKDEAKQAYFNQGPGYLLYTLLDLTIDSYFPFLDKIISLMEGLEDSVFDEVIEAAKDISVLRRDIMVQRRVMFPTRTLIIELENKLKRFAKINLSVYFGDLVDHMNKICETLDECKETIEVYMDTDYILSNERLGNVMRILTILSTIVLPILIVSSFYGMNVKIPGDMSTSDTFFTFISVILISLLTSLGLVIYFKKKRWI